MPYRLSIHPQSHIYFFPVSLAKPYVYLTLFIYLLNTYHKWQWHRASYRYCDVTLWFTSTCIALSSFYWCSKLSLTSEMWTEISRISNKEYRNWCETTKKRLDSGFALSLTSQFYPLSWYPKVFQLNEYVSKLRIILIIIYNTIVRWF